MSRHRIDVSKPLTLEDFSKLPPTKQIEDPETIPVREQERELRYKTIDKEPYQPDGELVEVVNLAMALGRPLLLQGEPGCGKTRLAYAVAYVLGLPLEVCAIKSTSRAQDLLYTYDAVNRLYDSQLNDPRCRDVMNYIRFGPLGRAIIRAKSGRRSVVLIDEIDKADLDFPNDLLWELDRLEFRVTEAPDLPPYAVDVIKQPELRPIIFVTNNEEKALPTAFLRRCIFHYLTFPDDQPELLQNILQLHDIRDESLNKKAIEVLLKLRRMEQIKKKPGLSELIDWVGYMQAVNTPLEELDRVPYIGTLLKQEYDRQQVRKEKG